MGCRGSRQRRRWNTRLQLYVALANLAYNLCLTAELSFNGGSLLKQFCTNACKVPGFRLARLLV